MYLARYEVVLFRFVEFLVTTCILKCVVLQARTALIVLERDVVHVSAAGWDWLSDFVSFERLNSSVALPNSLLLSHRRIDLNSPPPPFPALSVLYVSKINFREEAGPCEYIVWYCRMLTSGFLKLNADRHDDNFPVYIYVHALLLDA